MNKKYALSLKALKAAAIPRTPIATASLQQVLENPSGYSVSRRKVLGLASTFAVAAAPVASAMSAALNASYTIRTRGNRIAFLVAGVERWVLDPANFDGNPTTHIEQSESGVTVALTNAVFPGTSIAADCSATIGIGTKATMQLHFAAANSPVTVPFVAWLLNQHIAQAPINISRASIGNAHLNFGGKGAMVSMQPSFTLQFLGIAALQLQHLELASNAVSVGLATSSRMSLTTTVPKRRTVCVLQRGANLWDVPVQLPGLTDWNIDVEQTSFHTLTLEAESRSRIAGVFEGTSGTTITPATITAALPLTNIRYGFVMKPEGTHEALVARFSETPQWITVDGVGLELADNPEIPPLEIETTNGVVTRLAVAPGLRRYVLPIADAITSPTETHRKTQLAFLTSAVDTKALPKPHFHLASLQLDKVQMQVSGSSAAKLQSAGTAAQAAEKFKASKAKNKFYYTDKLVVAGNPKISVIRPEDLAVITVEFKDITLNRAAGTFTASGASARLIVHLQPQHIAERAFYYTDDQPQGSGGSNEPLLDPPIDAIMAHPSRLAFIVPPSYTGNLSIEGLLDWSKFTQAVSPSAKPPEQKFVLGSLAGSFIGKYAGDAVTGKNAKATKYNGKMWKTTSSTKTTSSSISRISGKTSPSIGKGIANTTPQEALTNYDDDTMQLMVSSHNDFSKAFTENLISDYINELTYVNPPIRPPKDEETAIEYPYRLILSPNKYAGWAHSKTLVQSNDKLRTELWHTRLGVKHSDGTVDENAQYFRTVRAIWSPDYGTSRTMEAIYRERPFRTSLNRRDRSEIVSLTSKYDLQTKVLPIPVKRMMLTSLGAWMDSAGAWDPVDDDGLEVEAWVQRGGQGRDSFVRVCYKGYLFPFGNRATLVKETERKFKRTPRGEMGAYLMQRKFIILRERFREFPAAGLTGMQYQGRNFPFRKIEITTIQTPNLEQPVSLGVPGMSPTNTFWPIFNHNGIAQDVQWACIGTDWDNKKITFSTPLIFVAGPDAGASDAVGKLNTMITNVYNSPGNAQRRTLKLEGQSVAYAQSIKMGDTSLPTTTLILDAYSQDSIPVNTPRFFPSMKKASARIEKVAEMLGTDGQTDIEFYKKFLEHAFEKGAEVAQGASANLNDIKNPSQIFIQLVNKVAMDFGAKSDKSGGLAAPSIDISGLSRLTGPIAGDLTNLVDSAVALGNFDPMQYFEGLLNSKILGDITLKDVLNFVQGILNNLDKMPGLDKKDDFNLDDAKNTLGEAKNAINDKITQIESAANELKNGINSEVEQAKQELKNLVDDIKDSDAYKFFDTTKKDAEEQIKKWKKDIEDKVNELKSEVEKAIKPLKEVGNEAYKLYETASEQLELLKQGITLSFEWRTEIKGSPGNILMPLYPGTSDSSKKSILYLRAALTKKLDLNPPIFEIYGSLSNFVVNLIGDGAAQFLIIKFAKLSFSSKNGAKPDINPDIDGVEFAGPLKFINKLKDLIPRGGSAGGVGFSFDFDVSPKGVVATLTIGLPNVTVGVFSLMNMSFILSVTIPFDGRPFSVYLAFCTKENPFRLTIMVFGGGGFFGIEITPTGVRMLEAAFEFGGNFAFDCGVASGGASVMAGVYYKLEQKEIDGKTVEQSELTGYFRLTGNLSILGIIRVSLLFELKLTWQSNGKVFGVATIEVEISILFISFSVGVTVERQLKGSDGDPTFTDMLPMPSLWIEYCNAFA